jgi:hypothetical protein
MNVRITFRGRPRCTHLYGGIVRIVSDGVTLNLHDAWLGVAFMSLAAVAEIMLDEDPGPL